MSDSELKTRQTLLIKIRDPNDSVAWDEFADLYTPLIYRFLVSRGLSSEDARDVMQESLKAVAGAIDRFEYDPEKGTFRSWLYTVVRSKLNNHFGREYRTPIPTGPTEVQGLVDEQGADDEAGQWELEYKRHMFHWATEKVRGDFQDNTWQAFWRTAVDEVAPEEVARELDMSPGSVYVAKSRVIAKLREAILSVTGELDGVPES